MSVEPEADDWWRSSDGKWYPPSMRPLPMHDADGSPADVLPPRDPAIAPPGPRPAPGWAQPAPPHVAATPLPLPEPPRAADHLVRREVIVTGTSKLAIAAISAGVAGFLCTGIASLVAVVTGHCALVVIWRSGGYLAGRGLAWGGLVLGYLQLISLGVLACTVLTAVQVEEQCASAYQELEAAAEAYRAASGTYPTSEDLLVPDWLSERSALWDLGGDGTSLTITSAGTC